MANPNIVDVSSIYGGSVTWTLGTGLTTIMEVDTHKLVKVNRIIATNLSATTEEVTLTIAGIGGLDGVTLTGENTEQYLVYEITVPPNATLVVLDTPIYMREGDLLKGKSSTALIMNILLSCEVMDDA